MVNKNNTHDKDESIIETINDEIQPESEDISPEDTELRLEDKLKQLRQKLSASEKEARELREELARNKADYLNARRRLDEERTLDQERSIIRHAEQLLPLYDSFYLAMLDKTTWEKADPMWRKGVEGIFTQLVQLLARYHITPFIPDGEVFDPNKHEALSSLPVTDATQHNQIQNTVQAGFILKTNTSERTIRPARVTVGEYVNESNITH